MIRIIVVLNIAGPASLKYVVDRVGRDMATVYIWNKCGARREFAHLTRFDAEKVLDKNGARIYQTDKSSIVIMID